MRHSMIELMKQVFPTLDIPLMMLSNFFLAED